MSSVVDATHLDEAQQLALFRMLAKILNVPEANDLNPIVLSAPGGFGKSHILRIASRLLTNAGVLHKVSSFTGRACANISKESGLQAKTLHSMMMQAVLDDNGDLLFFEDKDDKDVARDSGSAILIDESSMVPSEMFRRLLRISKKYKVQLIFIGDNSQLPPIEPPQTAGFNVMELSEKETERLELKVNYRQLEGSGIADLATWLRENNSIPRRKTDDLRMVRKSTVMQLEFHQQHKFDTILCGTNKVRRKLNNLVRVARGHHEEMPEEGETIICARNDVVNEQKINNGELYTILTRVKSSMEGCHDYQLHGMDNGVNVRVCIPDECWTEESKLGRKLRGKPIQNFRFGYAITVHQSQGSQFDKVLFVDEDVSFFLPQIRWRYTGVSRAKNALVIAR